MAEACSDLSLTVAVPPMWRDERGATKLERSHTRGYRLEVLPIIFNGSFHLHFYPNLNRIVRQVAPDLVHIDEEPYNVATYHANVVARKFGAKTLWFSWQNLARRYPPPFSWMERHNLTHVDHAIVGSQTAARVWRDKGYAGPLSVVPQFGVDPDDFAPSPQPRDGTTVHVAYVGRFVPEKGVDVLLNALARTSGEWRATLLGGGPAADALRRRVAVLGLSERVSFRSWLPSTEMPSFYRDVDILVLPSLGRPNWTEQFGRVLIEAMACEVTVIGSDTGEIPHVIGDAGRIFPEGDVAALSRILDELVAQPERRQLLGRRGRARVLSHYTQAEIARATVAVYQSVLGAA